MSIAVSARRRVAAVLCLLACGMANGTALARDTGTDRSLVIEKLRQSYVIEKDGTYVLTVDEVRCIKLARAIAPHSQRSLSYNPELDTIEDIAAYTEKPDGRRIALDSADIQERQQSVSTDMPQLPDTRFKTLVFPDVAVGDRLVLHYVLRRASALFPGHFEDLSSSRFYRNQAYDVHYDLPADMPLYADQVGFRQVPVDSPPGRLRYQWTYQAGENKRIEAGAVNYLDYGKRLAVSTFADYGAFAAAYQRGAAGKAVVTPAIAALAQELTAGLSDPRAKALALANWVRLHIAYVALYLGPGGVLPQAAHSVLQDRHGDGKDHVVLLEALLGAAGIDSTGALINNANVFRLPGMPMLGIFNHIITYIPELDLYIDSSAAMMAAGYLPDEERDKPVLLAKSGLIGRTPAFQREINRNKLHFDVAADGSSLFRVTKTSAGAMAEPYRQTLRPTTQDQRDIFVSRTLQQLGQRGYGVLDPGLVDGTGEEYQMVFAGVSENFLAAQGPSGIATDYDFWGGIGTAVALLAQEKQRRQEFICLAIERDDETAFRFAPGLSIAALPKALIVRGAGLAYRADYARAGNTVTVRRHLTFSAAGAVCTPADFKRMAPLLASIRRDLNSRIVIQAGKKKSGGM